MTDMTPRKPRRSILERADQRFDFGGQLRRIEPGEGGDGPLIEATPIRSRRSTDARKPARVTDEPVARPADADPQASAPEAHESPAPSSTTPAPTARRAPPIVHRRLVPSAPLQTVSAEALAENGLIDSDNLAGPVTEEFRLVKRQLLRNAVGLPMGRRILVTSAQPDEGKTFSAINLAIALASEKDHSVILIDGDSARGDVSRKLGLKPGKGLTELLANPAIDPASCIIPTSITGLAVLPSGPAVSGDTELLASARMATLLDQLEADAPERIILFDSMPLLAASSPGVLAHHCGQVVVVVRADVTREAALRDAIGLIGQHDAISLLLNRVRFTPEGRRFGSYYGEGG